MMAIQREEMGFQHLLGFRMSSFPVHVRLSGTLAGLALQRALFRAAQPLASPLWSVFLTRHSFHLVLFPKYVYANIQGTHQGLLLK